MKPLIKIRYDGTGFSGYQVQAGRRTVQGELCRAARELFGHECNVTGCSRTDAGVHAECFCAALSDRDGAGLTTNIPAARIPEAMNAHLPSDISVFDATCVEDDFHPRYSVKQKTYIYRILNLPHRDPFYENRAWFIPGVVFDDNAVRKMDLAAAQLVGRHDFSSFMAAGSKITDPVRTVTEARVTLCGDTVLLEISADGFLYNMVRIIAGTLVGVGRGRIAVCGIPEIIAAHDRSRAGVTAPPHGLYLHDVKY